MFKKHFFEFYSFYSFHVTKEIGTKLKELTIKDLTFFIFFKSFYY